MNKLLHISQFHKKRKNRKGKDIEYCKKRQAENYNLKHGLNNDFQNDN